MLALATLSVQSSPRRHLQTRTSICRNVNIHRLSDGLSKKTKQIYFQTN
jgi:hypothetical protein